MKINLFEPYIDDAEEKAVLETLRSKFWASGAGVGNVAKFENKFKKYVNADECLAVNSGTAALNISLSLLDIKNKEVIIPSLSFVSTANCVLLNGGIPKFVDVDPKTLCIKPELIEKSITKKTKTIIPVHFGGFPCDMKKILALGRKYGIKIIEDAAHATGASFSKKKIEARRWCGITNRNDDRYEVEEIGDNYYMNEISAAIGLVQLKKLDFANKKRRDIAKKYSSKLKMTNKMPYSEDCVYHFYWIKVKNREKFMKKMYEKGIETGIHYNPVHKMSYYKSKMKLPITEQVTNQIVSIPTHPNLTNSQVDKIIHAVNNLYDC